MSASHDDARRNVLEHYRRLLGRRRIAANGVKYVGIPESCDGDTGAALGDQEIADRVKLATNIIEERISKLVDESRKKHLLAAARRLLNRGSETLKAMANDDQAKLTSDPRNLASLEAIVRTDGSRPSFLVVNGEVDTASSPVGDWGTALYSSRDHLPAAIACVGRIDVPGTSVGFTGTGFLIAEDLLITNRHVLQQSATQDPKGAWRFYEGASVDFGHELSGIASHNRRVLHRVLFTGSQSIDYSQIDHGKLDLALIELKSSKAFQAPKRYLSLLSPGTLAYGSRIYTIGYPGDPGLAAYQPSLLELLFQSTFGHKRLAPGEVIGSLQKVSSWTITHDATTLGGNSGSVIIAIDKEGVAAGLHYGGRRVPPSENWGHVLRNVLDETDGTITTLREKLAEYGIAMDGGIAETHSDASIVGSHGTRGSSWKQSGTLEDEQAVASPSKHNATTVTNIRRSRRTAPAPQCPRITLAAMRRLGPAAGDSTAESPVDRETPADEFRGRRGYDGAFLTDWEVSLPQPSGDMRAIRRGGTGTELKYEHFSVIMSASRRMPIITACNVDGRRSRRLPRINTWRFDGRLDRDDQWGNDLYDANPLDKGHMVRREDPVWGSLPVANRANIDSFHYTNCCPQMAGVNQRIWLGLENYILSHTRDDEMRVSVFTGPIFGEHDRHYRNARVPNAFWKIVAFLTDDGRPSATAYRVSQAEELRELEFVFGGYKTFQISIRQVMRATGIDFGNLVPYDGFSEHEEKTNSTLEEQLESFGQIRV